MKCVSNNISIIKKKCTGCGACADICKNKAITYSANEEGFIYPSIDTLNCVNCGACLRVCHTQNIINSTTHKQVSLMAITRDAILYKNAASGGIWGTLSKAFLELYDNSFVCGASYSEGRVRHKLVSKSDYSSISRLQNSKYVQSDTIGVFKQIENYLEDGMFLLFSGTPCQVSGLHSFLKKDYDNLYTIDLICHGVPSPSFFKKDIDSYGIIPKRVDFRWKNALLPQSAYFLCFSSRENPSIHPVFGRKIISSNSDPYFSLFLRGASFRECCYDCQYAGLNRVGDITIGDCDSSSMFPSFHPKMSKSTVILNTRKGHDLWQQFNSLFDYQEIDIEIESKKNRQLCQSSERPSIRDAVYVDLNHLSSRI